MIQLIDKHYHRAFVYQVDEEMMTENKLELFKMKFEKKKYFTRNNNFEPNLSGNKSLIRDILGIVAIRL